METPTLAALLLLGGNLVLIGKIYGTFDTLIKRGNDAVMRLEDLVTSLFVKSEEHGNRITRLEVHQSLEKVNK